MALWAHLGSFGVILASKTWSKKGSKTVLRWDHKMSKSLSKKSSFLFFFFNFGIFWLFFVAFLIHFGAHFGTRSAKEGARWAQESHQELQRAKKLHFQKPWKTLSFLVFLDPEASKRTSRGPRRLLRDTQRDTQRWSKHWSNSGQIVNPKTSKNKKTKNRLPCLQDIFKKPQKTSKSEIFKVPQKSLIQAPKVTFSKNLKKPSIC